MIMKKSYIKKYMILRKYFSSIGKDENYEEQV